MKKIALVLFVALTAVASANGQEKIKFFNHLSVGVDAGLAGFGADVAMPIVSRWVDVEAGFTIMPKFKYSTELDLDRFDYKDANGVSRVLDKTNLKEIPVQGKLNMVNGKVLFNFYPMAISGFHITVGAYFGKSSIVEVYNKIDGQLSPINEANAEIDKYNKNIAIPNGLEQQQKIGLELDDYLLTPDSKGNAKASLKVHGFKPYVGIGFGRAVPKTKRIGFKVDLGAMFWGSPDIVDHNGHSLLSGIGSDDGGAIKVIKKFKVYPVLNFRLCGRIF